MSEMTADIWKAPAKLNLFLTVTGKREDGYHELQTLFQFLEIADELRFEVVDQPEITRIDANEAAISLALGDHDLCVQAARALQQSAGVDQGAVIYLEKHLPAGGGLGGGSSDAATTLIALNQLWGVGYSKERLIQIALGLGADVPIFIHGLSAIATGIGECFSPYFPKELWYVVITPRVQVSTAKIFSDPALTHRTPVKTIRGRLPAGLKNDLQAITTRLYPEVASVIDVMQEFGEAQMTGSGASVFLGVESELAAQQVLEQCLARLQACEGFISRGSNRHPLS